VEGPAQDIAIALEFAGAVGKHKPEIASGTIRTPSFAHRASQSARGAFQRGSEQHHETARRRSSKLYEALVSCHGMGTHNVARARAGESLTISVRKKVCQFTLNHHRAQAILSESPSPPPKDPDAPDTFRDE